MVKWLPGKTAFIYICTEDSFLTSATLGTTELLKSTFLNTRAFLMKLIIAPSKFAPAPFNLIDYYPLRMAHAVEYIVQV